MEATSSLFCWSTLGALATEPEDLFYGYEDALDLVLGYCGGGGQELCFLEGDEEGGAGGGGVFYFLGVDEDGGRGGREGDFCLLGVMARKQGR